MSSLWTPGGNDRPEPQPEDDGLPVVESTLTLACGHTTVTTDRTALRGADAIHDGRVEARAFCPNELCRTDRLIRRVKSRQVEEAPEPAEVDMEKELWDFEVKHGYRNPATGRRLPEHLGKDFI